MSKLLSFVKDSNFHQRFYLLREREKERERERERERDRQTDRQTDREGKEREREERERKNTCIKDSDFCEKTPHIFSQRE